MPGVMDKGVAMSTCDRCKNWSREGTTRNGNQYGVCGEVEYTHDGDRSPIETDSSVIMSVFSHDDTGLFARLITGPDFGCTNFRHMENKKA